MNLFAFAQIPDLEDVMRENNIDVPRLRGLDLMVDKEKYSKEEIEEWIHRETLEVYDSMCQSGFAVNPSVFEYSPRTDSIMDKYLIREKRTEVFFGKEVETKETVGIRWERIHGKRRKNVKFAVKKKRRRILAQAEAWNRYAGRNDVLYIHARIGAGNWDYYRGAELEKQPWFLEKVDDAFDCTYCDIYAKINPVSVVNADDA